MSLPRASSAESRRTGRGATPVGRRVALGVTLALTLGLTLWLAQQPDEPAAPGPVPPARTAAAVSVPQPAALARAVGPAPVAPAAEARVAPWPEPSAPALAAWAAPSVAQAAAAAPPAAPSAPRPPPFPYQWIGRLDDGQGPQALLNGPRRSFGVRAGEVLESRWRVDQVGASGLQLTWLPTGDVVHVAAR